MFYGLTLSRSWAGFILLKWFGDGDTEALVHLKNVPYTLELQLVFSLTRCHGGRNCWYRGQQGETLEERFSNVWKYLFIVIQRSRFQLLTLSVVVVHYKENLEDGAVFCDISVLSKLLLVCSPKDFKGSVDFEMMTFTKRWLHGSVLVSSLLRPLGQMCVLRWSCSSFVYLNLIIKKKDADSISRRRRRVMNRRMRSFTVVLWQSNLCTGEL